MVNIGLRVLARPQATMLPEMFRKLGLDFDERVLPSIMNEVLECTVWTEMLNNYIKTNKITWLFMVINIYTSIVCLD